MMGIRRWLIPILFALGVFLLALYACAPLFFPKTIPATAPFDQFSAERALRRVLELSRAPRVVGTAGMDQAVAYVVKELLACDLEPMMQNEPGNAGELHNVVVRLPGSNPEHAVLILSHVDSVSYGAGDNASGAAALIEVACALRAGSQLKNNIVLLFEDGEERGYLGGYAFARSPANMEKIRFVVGIDTAAWGPSILLQTTPGNSAIIQAYARSVKTPVAFGFFADADWNVSHDSSEIQPFYERGIPGVAFEDPTAFAGKHSAADTLDHIRPGSLQQMGNQLLPLARYLGNLDWNLPRATDLRFFTLWGIGLVRYPAKWNLFFAMLAGISLAVSMTSGFTRKEVRPGAVSLSTALLLLCLIASAAIGLLGSKLFSIVFPNPNPLTGSYLVPASLPSLLLITATSALVYLSVRRMLVRKHGSRAVSTAGLLCWLIFALATAVFLPVGSAIFTLPLLLAAAMRHLPSTLKITRWIPAAAATLLIVPNLVLAYLGTGLETLVLVNLFSMLMLERWAEIF